MNATEKQHKPLSGKLLLFTLEYLACWNGTEAARRAKYKGNDVTLASVAYENLRKPQVRDYIEERCKEKVLAADEVLARISAQAAATGDDFIDIVESPLIDLDGRPVLDMEGKPIIRYFPNLNLKKMQDRGKLHLVKEMCYTVHGPKVVLYDAQAALALLARYHGLLVDRHEITGADGGAIEVRPIDYRAGIAALAPGPVPDSDAPGQDEGLEHGEALG